MSSTKFKYLLVSALCFCGCSVLRVSWRKKILNGKVISLLLKIHSKKNKILAQAMKALFSTEGKDNPFSGSVEKNSTTRFTIDKYEAGLLNGLSIRKSSDGSWVEANYKAGKLHGEMIFYGKNGNVRSVMNYENGKLIPRNSALTE